MALPVPHQSPSERWVCCPHSKLEPIRAPFFPSSQAALLRAMGSATSYAEWQSLQAAVDSLEAAGCRSMGTPTPAEMRLYDRCEVHLRWHATGGRQRRVCSRMGWGVFACTVFGKVFHWDAASEHVCGKRAFHRHAAMPSIAGRQCLASGRAALLAAIAVDSPLHARFVVRASFVHAAMRVSP
eukprot:364891-Chlamydomonas_euryale.AAC.13